MLISGLWLLCEDNVVRPVLKGAVLGADGLWVPTEFLADTGADSTAFMGSFLTKLALPYLPAPQQLGGIGGATLTVAVATQIRFELNGGGTVLFQGNFAGFTREDALDMNVLGRDIMNLFAVIVDRPGNAVCLVARKHAYTIVQQP